MTGHQYDPITESLLAMPFVVACFIYLVCVFISNRRFKKWSVLRTLCWSTGCICALFSLYGPIVHWAHVDFKGHMVAHLLLGMLAPLLMVLAAPITLLLRTLPVTNARILAKWLKIKPIHFMMNPIVASLINIGGLWLLYNTELFMLMHHNSVIYMIIHVHIFLAGYVFTASMLQIEPSPQRTSYLFRSITLIVALAAHGILAKVIYVFPPKGVDRILAEKGAMLMYYGGDLIDAVIIFILCYQWYRHSRPRGVDSVGSTMNEGNSI
ncbi:cytochrome c oxidase assembly protein [Halalkalibacter sp. APA_J-10(15)]|uniref:cytochrome c oxidase assembly protein n=1 Tax=Halalkalibacter sp. APA_J-10(15) TaxID=2933805 RepID=UPI001FF51EA1|nr:cytochrome c oxidase assembly protein [Halalkalibacter sp. APA_J-10(15)]MCK0472903.1 cytochrome c oxidase assembly protein [Halalkalibacter sp. APA_J-10(15)]